MKVDYGSDELGRLKTFKRPFRMEKVMKRTVEDGKQGWKYQND